MKFNRALKKSGNWGEVSVYNTLKRKLPNASIYRHVALDYANADGEIPFLVINDGKVFLIDVNTWPGIIYEEQGEVYQEKLAHDGSNRTTKMESPYSKIEREGFAVKKVLGDLSYEYIVMFAGCDNLNVTVSTPSFKDNKSLVNYIKASTMKANSEKDINELLKRIKCYDIICGFKTVIPCTILESSFEFGGKKIDKKELQEILVKHHEESDSIKVILKDGTIGTFDIPVKKIEYRKNGQIETISSNSISLIEIA